ncbi:hypothetical protein ACFUCH_36085 [Streptomyces olivaceus]|uniref:hypothetical protein n=1 Tax=Streptomyces olivaceus TaxID=47716 RepID=UPI00362CD4B5
MDTTRNEALEAWMEDHQHSSNSLAKAVNEALEDLTGKLGTYDGRHVREWRSGRFRWPNTATRKVLEDISGMSAVDLLALTKAADHESVGLSARRSGYGKPSVAGVDRVG